MRSASYTLSFCAAATPLVIVSLAVQATRQSFAQPMAQEKPVLKEFGSSVRRLKWDPEKQAAVEINSDAARPAPSGDDVIRIDTQLVVCDVLILDERGRAVPDLKQDDFIVTEDSQLQQISHFSLGENRQVERSIVLVIDYSPSETPYLKTSVEAAARLVDRLGPKDRMAIVTDDVELLVDFTRDRKRLKDSLKTLRQKATSGKFGKSQQFTALMATLRELFSNEDLRRVVIFQTDGDEIVELQPYNPRLVEQIIEPGAAAEHRQEILTRSLADVKQFSLSDVSTAAERAGATVYGIFPGARLIGLSQSDQLDRIRSARPRIRETWKLAGLAAFQLAGQLAMTDVSQASGGWTAFLETPDGASEIYNRILSDVNSRYVIGYYPANKLRDGKRRRVLVTVRNHPEYVVEGRKAYFAPGPDN